MRVLVTGSSGCIGSWTVKQLLDRGIDVVCYDLEADISKTKLAKEFSKKKDGALFAALASWTMGRHKSGAHALPKRLWKYFDPLFTGKIYRTPWYDGGVP